MIPSQLPLGNMPEPNPFRPDVPDSIRALSPELHDFLRETVESLRRSHNVAQAGDTTFSWQMLTTLDDSPRYSVGSTGRFTHPDFGIMQAKYVKFDLMADGPTGAPAGLLRDSTSPWTVTNNPKQSLPQSVVGLMGAYVLPSNGQYGWVLAQGINIQDLTSTQVLPQGIQTAWAANGKVEPLGGDSNLLGTMISRSIDTRIPPGFFRVEVITSMLGGVYSNLDNLPTTETTFNDGLLRSITRLEKNFKDATLGISIISERLTRVTENSAEVELNSYMQAFANFRNIADVASKNASRYATRGEIALLATNDAERRAAVWRNQAGYFAEATNLSQVAASVNEAAARVSAGESAEASLTAQGYAAQALTYLTLAAQIGNAVNPNPIFALPWPQDQEFPPQWPQGNRFGDTSTIVATRGSPGRYGPYNWRVVRGAGPNDRSFYTSQAFAANRDYFLWHIEVYLEGPSWEGAGCLFRTFDANDVSTDQFIRFDSATRNDGDFGYNPDPRIYSWAIPCQVPQGTERIQLFMMPAWVGFGNTGSPLIVEFHRSELRVSVYDDSSASQEYTDARITEVNLAIANEAGARTTQYNNARSEYIGLTNGLDGRVTANTTSIASATTRIDTLSNAQGATATRVETLNTQYTQRFLNNEATTETVRQSVATVNERVTSVSNALGAEATKLTNLTATFNDYVRFYDAAIDKNSRDIVTLTQASAGYNERITANANAIAAEATKTESLNARFNLTTDSPLYSSVRNARLEADRAQERITTVVSTLAGYDERITANANAVGAEASKTESLNARFNLSVDSPLYQSLRGVDGRVTTVTNTVATFDNRITTNANQLGAQATLIQSLTAKFDRSEGSALNDYVQAVLGVANNAQNTANQGVGDAATALAKGVQNAGLINDTYNFAAQVNLKADDGIVRANNAQGTANAAANRAEYAVSEVGNAQGRITNVVDTLSGYDQRITTNANALGAQAGSITNIFSALAGETPSGLRNQIAAVQVIAQTSVDLVNGVRTKYGVYLNNDGTIGGFELLGAGDRIAFTVRADDIAFMTDGGRKTPFAVSGSNIYLTGDVRLNGNLILNGTIITDGIALGAVTQSLTVQEGLTTASNGQQKIGATLNASVRAESTIRIDVQYDARSNAQGTTGSCQVSVQRVKDGQTTTVGRAVNVGNSNTFGLPASFWLLDNPGAGAVTYQLFISTDSGNRIFAFNLIQLMLQEFKR